MSRRAPTPLRLAVTLAALLAAACRSDDAPCPEGQVVCEGVCVDPASFQSDAANCGACGVRCGLGTCAGGVCQCEAATLCAQSNPRCVDLAADVANCGACGAACTKPGARCEGGTCGCFAPGDDDCGTYCADTLTDPANCGADAASGCGNVCPLANDVCAAGVCACPTSLPTKCGNACVDTLTDASNCGSDASACGNVCPLTNDVCVGGECACPASLPDACLTACVNLATDEANCGTCGHVCPLANDVCTSRACACPASLPDACPTACVSLATDEANCGACGARCATGASCTGGDCACPGTKPTVCGSAPGACCAGTGCCDGACQTAHANGLGQTYYDCGALDTWTVQQARLAAEAWDPAGTTVETGLCSVYCLCRQSEARGAAAVWCYAGSNAAGLVLPTNSPNCLAAQCPFLGNGVAWH